MLRKRGWGGDETVTAPAAATEAAYVACRASRSYRLAHTCMQHREMRQSRHPQPPEPLYAEHAT